MTFGTSFTREYRQVGEITRDQTIDASERPGGARWHRD